MADSDVKEATLVKTELLFDPPQPNGGPNEMMPIYHHSEALSALVMYQSVSHDEVWVAQSLKIIPETGMDGGKLKIGLG